ncbi:MAG: MlaD family protein, partial [Steroidobacteraceae bacterium]
MNRFERLVGLQLDKRSDVKVRGLTIGEVTDVSSSGDVAMVHMMLKPEL